MAVLLAALSAATFGVGDFFGGLSARRMAAVLTTAIAQSSGLLVIVAVTLVSSGDPTGTDLAFGAAAGISGGIGLMLFYWAMAKGPMSVVAPVSAFLSAAVPVAAGLVDGERPAPLAVLGILFGLPAIVLISREPRPDETPPGERWSGLLGALGGRTVVVAALSGIGFGVFFTLLSRTSQDSGLWPLVSSRGVATALAIVVIVARRPGRPRPGGVQLALLTGCIDALGNALYLLAAREGLLTLVGVVGAMYPASTVVLARFVLRERIARHQVVGLGTAAVAVTLIALG